MLVKSKGKSKFILENSIFKTYQLIYLRVMSQYKKRRYAFDTPSF